MYGYQAGRIPTTGLFKALYGTFAEQVSIHTTKESNRGKNVRKMD